MKKILASLAVAAALTQVGSASVIINFGLGTMYSSTNTSSFFASGGLINLLAVTNGQTWATLPAFLGYTNINHMFANTTSGFAPTGTVLLGKIGNDDSGGSGVTGGSYEFTLTAGYELMTVGYSSLTTNSVSPGNSTAGFFFRSATAPAGSDIAWVVPSDGSVVNMAAYTLDQSGDQPNNQFTSGTGAAGGNGFTTVPEPSTYALLAMSALGLGGYVVRRRNRS